MISSSDKKMLVVSGFVALTFALLVFITAWADARAEADAATTATTQAE